MDGVVTEIKQILIIILGRHTDCVMFGLVDFQYVMRYNIYNG